MAGGAGYHEKTIEDVELLRERTLHEVVKREERELKLSITRGDHLSQAAVRQAAATAVSMLVQSLRAIPDNLERTLNLPPAAVESVARQIDEALTELAGAMKAMAGDG